MFLFILVDIKKVKKENIKNLMSVKRTKIFIIHRNTDFL